MATPSSDGSVSRRMSLRKKVNYRSYDFGMIDDGLLDKNMDSTLKKKGKNKDIQKETNYEARIVSYSIF